MQRPATAEAFVRSVPRLGAQVELTRTAEGLIRLRGPERRRAWLLRLMRLPQRVQVELDDIGTFVVERFGRDDVGTLVRALAGHLRLSLREAEVALGDFLAMLERRRLIEFSSRERA